MKDPTLAREAQIHFEGLTVKAGVRGNTLAFPNSEDVSDAHLFHDSMDEISRAILAQMFTPETLDEMYAAIKRGDEIEGIVNGPAQ